MAKRYQIINVLRKPHKCPNCGEEVWDIIYGTGDLDDLMHTFEWLQDKFAADPDLELKLQD